MRRVSRENMKKFELYSKRNIFTSPSEERVTEDVKTTTDRSLAESQREHYASLLAENTRLHAECSQKEALLADMTSALFHIRVGTQAFDMYDVNPLEDTLEGTQEKSMQLESFIKRATGETYMYIYVL